MVRETYLHPTPSTSLLHSIDPIYTGLGLLNANFRCSPATTNI